VKKINWYIRGLYGIDYFDVVVYQPRGHDHSCSDCVWMVPGTYKDLS
jgi:hypothetical protein